MSHYKPTTCYYPTCAYPFKQCADCSANYDKYGMPNPSLANPNGTYQAARGLEPYKVYSPVRTKAFVRMKIEFTGRHLDDIFNLPCCRRIFKGPGGEPIAILRTMYDEETPLRVGSFVCQDTHGGWYVEARDGSIIGKGKQR